MISKEQNLYLRILSDYLHGRKTDVLPEFNTDALRRLSSSQQTNAIVYS